MDWQWQFDNPTIVSRVPNVMTIKGSQGLFQADQPGQTTLTVVGDPPCRKAQPACASPSVSFRALIVAAPGPAATPAAPNTVTTADNGQTITLHVGESFLLKLGDQYDWDVTLDDPTIVSRVVNILVVKGAQGVYKANKTGETTLSAVGKMVCPPGQACPMIAVAFKIQIVVK